MLIQHVESAKKIQTGLEVQMVRNKWLRLRTFSAFSNISKLKLLGKEYEQVTVYLTHSLIPIASCTDLGVGDVEVPSVHLPTPLITD